MSDESRPSPERGRRALRPTATRLSFLLPAVLLAACSAPQPPAAVAPAPSPVVGTVPGTPGETAPAGPTERTQPLQALGLLDIKLSGLNDDGTVTASVQPAASLGAQALTNLDSVQAEVVSTGSFTVGQRGSGGVRYVSVTFRVRNASAAKVAYGTARQNLTLLGASTPGTIGETPYSQILRFDGTPAAAAIASTILPTPGMAYDRATDTPRPLAGAQDLQVFTEGEVAALGSVSGTTRVFPFGFVVRNRTQTANRILAANPAADQYDGVVTIALKFPLQADAAADPFSVMATFAVVDDPVTRVTQSTEEQAVSDSVQARAAALGTGTQIATLCGTTLTGTNTLFIGSATTAGNTTRTARIGGNVALKNLPTASGAIGNTTLNVPAAQGLSRFYSVYSPSTLTFAGTGTARGGTATVASDGGYTFTSKAGDGVGSTATSDSLNYTVGDGAGCTSPTQTAPVSVNQRVWYVNNAANGAGDGRQITPFQTLAAAQSASAAADTIYVFRGNGTTSGQNAGLVLKDNQTLIGEGNELKVGEVTVLPAGAAPASIGNSNGVGLTLASGNTVRGLNVSGTAGGIVGTNFGKLSATLGSVTATAGPALNLTTGTLDATAVRLDATNPASAGAGVDLTGVGGSLKVLGSGSVGTGGTVQATGTNGVGYRIRPGNADLTLGLARVQAQNSLNGLLFSTATTDTGRVGLTVSDSAFTNNTSRAVFLESRGTGANSFLLERNSVSNTSGTGGIVYTAGRTATANSVDRGVFRGNTVAIGNMYTGGGSGFSIVANGNSRGQFLLENNTVSSFNTYGMELRAGQLAETDTGSARLDLTLRNNTVSTPSAAASEALEGIGLTVGIDAAETDQLCANLTGNTISAQNGGTIGAQSAVVVRQRGGTTFTLTGLSGTGSTGTTNTIASRNNGATTRIRNPTTLSPVAGTCTEPSLP